MSSYRGANLNRTELKGFYQTKTDGGEITFSTTHEPLIELSTVKKFLFQRYGLELTSKELEKWLQEQYDLEAWGENK